MTRTKNNPKLSHDQWLLIQKDQIKMMTKLQEENDELKKKVEELIEELLKRNLEVKEESERMQKKSLKKNSSTVIRRCRRKARR